MSMIIVSWDEDRAADILEKVGGYGIGTHLYAVPGNKAEELKKKLYMAGPSAGISVFHIGDLNAYLVTMGQQEGFDLLKGSFPRAKPFDISGRP